MRTQEEIFKRYKESEHRDMFGFESSAYLEVMTLETARPLLKPVANQDSDKVEWSTKTLDEIDKTAKGYLNFWKEKIDNERGISVQRATMHYTAWKWLLGHSDSDTFPGSFNATTDGGYYQIAAYNYIVAQIESGEWDKMTVK